MEVHKPKPIHGWRDLIKEIGTIVLGVSIALAAEQGVEWWHWHNKVAEAREIIAAELATSVGNTLARLRVQACGERRLDALAHIVDVASRSGALPPMGTIGAPPNQQWPSGAWDGIVASQTATHFPGRQLAELAIIYGYVRKADDFNMAEPAAWTDLDTMVGPGRRLDAASEDRLRGALGRARQANRSITLLGVRIVQRIQKIGVVFSKDDLALLADAHQRALSSPANLCKPVGAPPAAYTEAPMAGSLPAIDAMAKAPPDFSKSGN